MPSDSRYKRFASITCLYDLSIQFILSSKRISFLYPGVRQVTKRKVEKKKKGKRKGEDLLSRRDDDFDSFPFRVDLRRNARRFYAASFPMFVLMDEGEEIGRKG